MEREIIDVPVISAAIHRLGAPTSAIVRYGNLIATCGMPPIDVETGDIVRGNIRTQASASLGALSVSLKHAGSSLEKTIKATVYVTDAAFMAEVNEVFREYFSAGFPARTSAIVKPWGQGFDLEIECLAVL